MRDVAATTVGTSPFLKWAGGKRRLVPHLREHLALPAKRLVEPFAGSAALSLALAGDAERFWLNDMNADLTNVFEQLKKKPLQLIPHAKSFFTAANNTPEVYYQLRQAFNSSRDALDRAALFVYLNRHGYNGLCRYNSTGEFNVPFGRYNAPYFPELELRQAAAVLQRTKITTLDFEEVLDQCGPGDVVYCDPPYVPLSQTASFTDYAAGGFDEDDQRHLAAAAERAAGRGALVVLSNHATPFTKQLYSGADKFYVDVRRTISCDGENRALVQEVIAVFTPAAQTEAIR